MELKNNCGCGNYRIDLEPNQCFCIKVGEFKGYNKAMDLQIRLLCEGYFASLIKINDLYTVQVGKFDYLEEAASMEISLRQKGYNTMTIGTIPKI